MILLAHRLSWLLAPLALSAYAFSAMAVGQDSSEDNSLEGSITNGTLDVCDVTWLLPAPVSVPDMNDAISIEGLFTEEGLSVWTDDDFRQFLEIATSQGVRGEEEQVIAMPAGSERKAVWKIAGMRIDPSAPGTSEKVREQFGSAPQIRLILQPVTISNGAVRVHDVTAHLLYTYAAGREPASQAGQIPRIIPDSEAFNEILGDIMAMKAFSEELGAPTSGEDLDVHPAFRDTANAQQMSERLKSFLEEHCDPRKLTAMAVMGLPNGFEPWIFVAMQRGGEGQFGVFPNPGIEFNLASTQVQMLSMLGGNVRVVPSPVTNNRNAISSVSFLPSHLKRGVATAVLFDDNLDLEALSHTGIDELGEAVTDTEVRNRDIPDIIANPQISHFFNTDCVSCHSESTRRNTLNLAAGQFAFQPAEGISGLSPTMASSDRWNVRNLGWFATRLRPATPAIATASMRTFNETAEVVEFLNENF